LRHEVGVATISDRALEKLRTTKRTKKYIFNIPNYDILSNMIYADSFLFEQINKRVDHANSNVISSLLYLGEKKMDGKESEKSSNRSLASLLAKKIKVDMAKFDI